jgi:uncharacterized membrane protein YhaH (DUF805 family)
MNLYLQAWKKYAVFNGRARRKEYCYLFYMLIYIVLAIIDGVAGTFSEEAGVGLLSGIYGLAALLPSIGVSIRRRHDTKRQWLVVVYLVDTRNRYHCAHGFLSV